MGKKKSSMKEKPKGFTDVAFEEQRSLYKTDAFVRSGQVSNVSYKVAYALNRGGETF
jgi:hypothetical protein